MVSRCSVYGMQRGKWATGTSYLQFLLANNFGNKVSPTFATVPIHCFTNQEDPVLEVDDEVNFVSSGKYDFVEFSGFHPGVSMYITSERIAELFNATDIIDVFEAASIHKPPEDGKSIKKISMNTPFIKFEKQEDNIIKITAPKILDGTNIKYFCCKAYCQKKSDTFFGFNVNLDEKYYMFIDQLIIRQLEKTKCYKSKANDFIGLYCYVHTLKNLNHIKKVPSYNCLDSLKVMDSDSDLSESGVEEEDEDDEVEEEDDEVEEEDDEVEEEDDKVEEEDDGVEEEDDGVEEEDDDTQKNISASDKNDKATESSTEEVDPQVFQFFSMHKARRGRKHTYKGWCGEDRIVVTSDYVRKHLSVQLFNVLRTRSQSNPFKRIKNPKALCLKKFSKGSLQNENVFTSRSIKSLLHVNGKWWGRVKHRTKLIKLRLHSKFVKKYFGSKKVKDQGVLLDICKKSNKWCDVPPTKVCV